MFELAPTSALAFLPRGHHGSATTGITAHELSLSLTALIARKGQSDALNAAVKARFGLDLLKGRRSGDDALSFVSTGPDQWLCVAAQHLELIDLGAFAALTDQSDGRSILRLAGPKIHAMLRKGVTLNLHDFAVNDAAVTVISHISAHIWRVSEDTYDISVPRSFAGSFWHWVSVSAAEFGLEVV